jgi:hypothetical protein
MFTHRPASRPHLWKPSRRVIAPWRDEAGGPDPPARPILWPTATPAARIGLRLPLSEVRWLEVQ